MATRLLIGLMAGLAFAALSVGAVSAAPGGAGTVSMTEHFSGVIDQESTTNPCTGQPGMLTLDATNAVAHVTTNANGFWATFTAQGTATFAPINGTPISGHFTAWDGENGNLQNGTATMTLTIHLGGLAMHETAHMSVSASGISLSFDKSKLTCS